MISSKTLSLLLLISVFISCNENTKETQTKEIQEKDNETKEVKADLSPDQIFLKEALTFYTSFDNGIDADFAKGDKMIYSVPNRKAIDSARAGIHKPGVSILKGQGRFGNALDYKERSKGYIYYKSQDNMNYNTENWEGAISFWLSLDPAVDLEPGYCDPIQITDSGYNDAGFWVDFTKENPRDFRLGVIGDRDSWNPKPEGPDKILKILLLGNWRNLIFI